MAIDYLFHTNRGETRIFELLLTYLEDLEPGTSFAAPYPLIFTYSPSRLQLYLSSTDHPCKFWTVIGPCSTFYLASSEPPHHSSIGMFAYRYIHYLSYLCCWSVEVGTPTHFYWLMTWFYLWMVPYFRIRFVAFQNLWDRLRRSFDMLGFARWHRLLFGWCRRWRLSGIGRWRSTALS